LCTLIAIWNRLICAFLWLFYRQKIFLFAWIIIIFSLLLHLGDVIVQERVSFIVISFWKTTKYNISDRFIRVDKMLYLKLQLKFTFLSRWIYSKQFINSNCNTFCWTTNRCISTSDVLQQSCINEAILFLLKKMCTP